MESVTSSSAAPLSHAIVPQALVIKAMRDNGYKNAAYALAELVDNSVQAGARRVDVLVGEQASTKAYERARIVQIGVLDDGCGMDAATLRMALQFGNGTRLDPSKHDGIGRFGMGLPSASISQCTQIKVWSWQEGTMQAHCTFLDLGEIASGRMLEVPQPVPQPVPQRWISAAGGPGRFGRSGTLVVWEDLDRLVWKTSSALFKNSERIVGRMYRAFLDEALPERARLDLRFVAFDYDHPAAPATVRRIRPNDPGYLMARTSCPAPWHDRPMFELVHGQLDTSVTFRGARHPVHVRFSVAKEEARRDTRNAGSAPHGKHAAENVGVSIVRAGRELELDTSWVIGYDPRERWWGVEVSFPPALDEVFGVTNNKQAARNLHLTEAADVFESGRYSAEEAEQLRADGDPAFALYEISKHIRTNLSDIRERIRRQTDNFERQQKRAEAVSGGPSDGEAEAGTPATPEVHATRMTEQRVQDDPRTAREGDEEAATGSAEERKEHLVAALEADGLSESEIAGITATVDFGVRYQFVNARFESRAFFSCEQVGGVHLVKLNTEHPAYRHLVEVLEKADEAASEYDLRQRLARARDGLKLVLMAWARYEYETGRTARVPIEDIRADWGRLARDFLIEDAA